MPTFGRSMLEHWLLDPDITYLNHGTVGALPKRVLQKQQALRDEMERQPSRSQLREPGPETAGSLAARVGVFPIACGDDAHRRRPPAPQRFSRRLPAALRGRLRESDAVPRPEPVDRHPRRPDAGGSRTLQARADPHRGLAWCVIAPPDTIVRPNPRGFRIDAGPVSDLETPPTLPAPPAGVFSWWFFVQEWNTSLYVAGQSAALEWKF